MFKKETQKRFFKFLERELITVLAVSIIGVGALFSQAATSNTIILLTVIPAGGTITVTAPDGGESWNIGSSQNITWTTVGDITDVKIELQRTVAGSWEDIVASTTNDGTYPWAVTSPTSSTATVRISKVGDESVTDSSDAVFTIKSAGGGGVPPISLPAPAINDVIPSIVINNSDVVLDIYGFNFGTDIYFELNRISLEDIDWVSSTYAKATVPSGFEAGLWDLRVFSNGMTNVWGNKLKVVASQYEATSNDQTIYLRAGEKREVVVEATNTSNQVWGSDLFLGTLAPQDRNSVFYDSVSWASANRIEYSGDPVSLNEVAEFKFTLQAPDLVGEYSEEFGLLIEGDRWLNMEPIVLTVFVLSIDGEPLPPPLDDELYYDARLIDQSFKDIQLKPDQTTTLWVEYQNTGTLPWYLDGANSVHLGTGNNEMSQFEANDWVDSTHVSKLTKTVYPDETITMSFTIRAPLEEETFAEYFSLLAGQNELFGDKVSWNILVTTTDDIIPIAPIVDDGGERGVGTTMPSDGGVRETKTDFIGSIIKLFDDTKGVAIPLLLSILFIGGVVWLFQTQIALGQFTWLKEELITVLAISIIGMSVVWTYADVGVINVGLTVIPAGGAITVTAPDGGENWAVGASKDITWTTIGPINDVKIELQRLSGGSWEEIIVSTTDDGTYPWSVTSPTTSQATVRVSKVGDASTNDTSDATFRITSTGGGGGASTPLPAPVINDVVPSIVINNFDVVLDIYGSNFDLDVYFELDNIPLEDITRISTTHAEAIVPTGFKVGLWNLRVVSNGMTDIWENRVEVKHQGTPDSGVSVDGDIQPDDEIDKEESEEDEVQGIYSAKWIAQSPYPTLEIGQETTLWVEFQNTGTLPWYPDGDNPVRLGTSRGYDRHSRFETHDVHISDPSRHGWVLLNRPAVINGVVQPGGVGIFTFDIVAPRTLSLGNHREYFQPVVEYIEWMEDYGVYWDINITGRPGLIGNLFGTTPKVEVVTPVVVEPEPKIDEDVFIDPFELFFGSFRFLFGGIEDWFNGWF